MRDPEHPVSLAMDAPPRPVRSFLPLSPVLLFVLRAGQLEPDQIVAAMIRRGWLDEAEARVFERASSPTSLVWGYERHPMAEMDGIALQKLHEQFPDLAHELLEPCLDPGCDGPMSWGDTGPQEARRPKRTLWDLIRHMRRDHQWSCSRLAMRLAERL
jgi:hypothetical protein